MASGDNMEYVYESPVCRGYIRLLVSRRQHNKLLPNLKQRIGAKVEYYYSIDENTLIIQYFTSLPFKILAIPIMLIPSILMHGIPETVTDISDVIYERKRGKFTKDIFFLNHEKTTDGALETFISESIAR